MPDKNRTIKEEVRLLGRRKRPLSYVEMVGIIHERHPDASTSVKTVQWYASRLRMAGEEVNVKDGREARRGRRTPSATPGADVPKGRVARTTH